MHPVSQHRTSMCVTPAYTSGVRMSTRFTCSNVVIVEFCSDGKLTVHRRVIHHYGEIMDRTSLIEYGDDNTIV